MSPYKITLATQARWTGYGLVGGLLPTLLIDHYHNPNVTFGSVLLACFVGAVAGVELARSEFRRSVAEPSPDQ